MIELLELYLPLWRKSRCWSPRSRWHLQPPRTITRRNSRTGRIKMARVLCVDGQLEITSPHGLIRCVGSGRTIELIFRDVWQLARSHNQFRSVAGRTVGRWLFAAAGHAGLEVSLRIGNRRVGNVSWETGRKRPKVKLRFPSLIAAAVSNPAF